MATGVVVQVTSLVFLSHPFLCRALWRSIPFSDLWDSLLHFCDDQIGGMLMFLCMSCDMIRLLPKRLAKEMKKIGER